MPIQLDLGTVYALWLAPATIYLGCAIAWSLIQDYRSRPTPP